MTFLRNGLNSDVPNKAKRHHDILVFTVRSNKAIAAPFHKLKKEDIQKLPNEQKPCWLNKIQDCSNRWKIMYRTLCVF
jgi:hypothetical protein